MKLHRSIILLTAMAVLFAGTAYLRGPILSAIAAIQLGPEVETTVASFDSSRDQPIELPQFSQTGNVHVQMAFRFRATSMDGYPNLVQTADDNKGMRLELHQGRLAVAYPTEPGLYAKVLSEDIRTGRWYDVAIEFQSGDFLRASCSEGASAHETLLAHTLVDKVMVGRGFNPQRGFVGQIENFSIRSSPRVGMVVAETLLLGFKLLLIAGAGFALWQMARSGETESEPAIGLIEAPAMGAIDPLLTLRAFALVQVLIGHLLMCVFVSPEFIERLKGDFWLHILARAPWAGVWVFFTLSGYLMGKGFYTGRYSLAPQRVYRYVSNRLLRIVPVYASALLLVAFFLRPQILELRNLSLLGSILIFDYNGNQRLNPIGALWSVSTEVQFYALVPFLFWGLSRLVGDRHERALKLSAAILGIGLVGRLVIRQIVGREGVFLFIYSPLLTNLDVFVIGMLANPLIAVLRSKPWVTRYATVPSALAVIVGGYVLSCFVGARVFTSTMDIARVMVFGPVITAPLTVLAIICCELGSASQTQAGFFRRALVVGSGIGVLTYPFYVWHEPIMLTVRQLAPTPLGLLDAFKFAVIASFLSWAVAELIYRYIELPTEHRKKKKQSAEAAIASSAQAVADTIPLPEPAASPQLSKAA